MTVLFIDLNLILLEFIKEIDTYCEDLESRSPNKNGFQINNV